MRQLNEAPFKSMVTPDVIKLRDIFKKYGFEIRIAGGAVRDVVMSKPIKDLDFATTASVQQMKQIFIKENVSIVNPKGEEHGTVTANIYPRSFEITTINNPRRSTEDNWISDAKRRDLTINSMFLDFDRYIHDHLGGYDDLTQGKIRFIASADEAIAGRHARILRYFRFHSQFAKNPRHHEDGILQAIKRNAAGLQQVPGERIWKELKIIFQEKSRYLVLKTMLDVGIGPYIGLRCPNIAEFQDVSDKNEDTDIEPASLLAALLNNIQDVDRSRSRFKYSTDEGRIINFIMKNREITTDDSLLPYLQLIYTERKFSRDLVIKYVIELLLYNGAEELIDELEKISEFPIDMAMLKLNGVPTGKNKIKKYKFVVEELIEYWYVND